MIPAPKRRKLRNFDVKPFPTDCKLIGTFTGLDVEVFDQNSIKLLSQCGNYGNNAINYRQRQLYSEEKIPIVSQNDYQRKLRWNEKYLHETSSQEQKLIKVEESIVPDPFPITQSHVLILEEAMFLHKELKCLEIKDMDDNLMTTEDLWKEFCDLKHNFVECYVGYLYLKSKNWVIKSGIKFGGHFSK
jgi:tRNA-splicing endonuclease subunit Sen2